MRRAAVTGALVGLGLLAVIGVAGAQGIALGSSEGGDQPLDIEADDGIEWRRDQQVYFARGNAKAVRGTTTVRADVLTAHYRPRPGGQTEVWRLEAIGNVTIASPTETAYGDRAVYEIDSKILVITGRKLRLETPTDVITARGSLEYWEERRLAVARGNALVVRADREIRADTLTARFLPDKDGTLQLNRIDAFGNVDVRTPKEIARGEQGVYTPANGVAILVGSVRITQNGRNQLNGEVAEVNLNTGVSRLLSAARGEQAKRRVRGLFVPEPSTGG